jgi:mono/diheme cytochrome c family protein
MRKAMLIVLLVFAVGGMAVAQQVKKVPVRYTTPASGAETYKAYCASCHGVDGKGAGPAAIALKANLPDLTKLPKTSDGKFATEHVSQLILGDSVIPAHGDKTMPVWGPAFLAMDQRDRAVVMLRMKNLTTYIEGMQAK